MNKHFIDTLEKIGDKNLKIEEIDLSKGLPVIYLKQFRFFKIVIFTIEYILVYCEDNEISKIDIIKALKMIGEKQNLDTILFLDLSSSQQRNYYRNHHFSYIDSKGNYFIYPKYLNEQENKNSNKQITTMSINAQLILLYFLNIKNKDVEVEDLKQYLYLKDMTLSRALSELIQLDLIQYKTTGATNRKRIYEIENRLNTFNRAKNYMNNPIRKKIYTEDLPDNVVFSSDSALARLTMLSEPDTEVVAIFYKSSNIKETYRGKYQVELWSYDPKLFSTNDCVDKYSLSLLFRNSQDSRILIVLEELMNSNDTRN